MYTPAFDLNLKYDQQSLYYQQQWVSKTCDLFITARTIESLGYRGNRALGKGGNRSRDRIVRNA